MEFDQKTTELCNFINNVQETKLQNLFTEQNDYDNFSDELNAVQFRLGEYYKKVIKRKKEEELSLAEKNLFSDIKSKAKYEFEEIMKSKYEKNEFWNLIQNVQKNLLGKIIEKYINI